MTNLLADAGYKILTKKHEYNHNGKVAYEDVDGYRYSKNVENIIRNTKENKLVGKQNIYSLYNINRYLELHKIPFKCVSNEYIGAEADMEFECNSCKTHTFASWHDINKKDNPNRNYIICPNCGGRLESVHALVLKQVFKHEHPDTIEEEKSCRNPITGKILPTDIVNHRLKIAIEVQSQWHDSEYSKQKDLIKKQFWIDKGYTFYALDIRDYSVIDMCKVFFDIDEIPEYINMNYSNKINIKEVQKLLDDDYTVPEIENITGIKRHRIYDAIQSGKIKYPDQYYNSSCSPMIQLDKNGNYIREYSSINEIDRVCGFKRGAISSVLNKGRHYSCGYFWYRKDEYDQTNIDTKSRFSRFFVPVDKYTKDGTFVCSYDTIIDASKDCNVSNTQIYNVLIGKNKTTGGYQFKPSKNTIL